MRMGNELAGAKIKYFYKNLREQVSLLVRPSGAGSAEILQGGATSLDVFYREDGEVERISYSRVSRGLRRISSIARNGKSCLRLSSSVFLSKV